METPDDAGIFDTEAVVRGSQSDVEHVPLSLHRRDPDGGGTQLGVKSDKESCHWLLAGLGYEYFSNLPSSRVRVTVAPCWEL